MPLKIKTSEPVASAKDLGMQALKEKNWLEAVDHFHRALDHNPTDVEALNALANALCALGNTREARSVLGRAVALQPDFADPYRNLAVLLAREGRALEAAEIACKAFELAPECSANFQVLNDIRSLLRSAVSKGKKGRRKKTREAGYTLEQINSCLSRINRIMRTAAASQSYSKAVSIRPSVSLCMIVKNEESVLSECLSSARDLVDEIVVVDTGSTDGTIEVAKSYNAQVYNYEWTDSFSDARNQAISRAHGDWILVLDADERLDPSAHKVIREAITKPVADAYTLNIYNYGTESGNAGLFIHRTCRLFRNRTEYRYEGRVHERITSSIERSGGKLAHISAIIHHYGYKPDVVQEKQKHERYIQLLLADLDENPNDVFCLYNLSSAYTSAGNYEKALEYLAKVVPLVSPRHEFGYAVYCLLTQALCNLGRPDEAITLLKHAVQTGFHHPEVYFQLGSGLLLTGKYEEAIDNFLIAVRMGEKAFWIGDQDVAGYKAFLAIASCYMGIGEFPKVIQYCEKVIKLRPEDAKAHELLALAYMCTGDFTRAEHHIQRYLDMNPEDSQVLCRLGETLLAQQKYERAERIFRKTLALNGESATAHMSLADSLRLQGKLEEAEKHYLRAIELEPECIDAHIGLGKNYHALGDFHAALECFAKCVDMNPKCANAYFSAGDLLYSIGRYQEAADAYQNGLTYYPTHAAGFLALGNCYFNMQAFEAAALAYRQSLSLDPGCKQASSNLGLCLERLRQVA